MKSKSMEQFNMIANFSFTSMSECNSMFKSFTSAGRDFDSMVKFNASTGEEYAEWLDSLST